MKLVEGTTVSMPETRANQARFPQSRAQKPGLGFPVARLVAVVSLSAGAALDWALSACEGKKTGETALWWQWMPQLARGDVAIADGYYRGYFMIARLVALGVDVLMPQHHLRATDFRRGNRLGARERRFCEVPQIFNPAPFPGARGEPRTALTDVTPLSASPYHPMFCPGKTGG